MGQVVVTRRDGSQHVILFDDVDEELVLRHRWYVSKGQHSRTFYAATNILIGGRRTIRTMHRLLLPDVPMLDHVNRNGLDNRRENLRPASPSQNHANVGVQRNNTSGYKGVYWNKGRQKWQVQIHVSGKNRCVGRFVDLADAVAAYDAAALEAWGEYALTNERTG